MNEYKIIIDDEKYIIVTGTSKDAVIEALCKYTRACLEDGLGLIPYSLNITCTRISNMETIRITKREDE
jgi:hypothetical protein